jgi:hypothetical protein
LQAGRSGTRASLVAIVASLFALLTAAADGEGVIRLLSQASQGLRNFTLASGTGVATITGLAFIVVPFVPWIALAHRPLKTHTIGILGAATIVFLLVGGQLIVDAHELDVAGARSSGTTGAEHRAQSSGALEHARSSGHAQQANSTNSSSAPGTPASAHGTPAVTAQRPSSSTQASQDVAPSAGSTLQAHVSAPAQSVPSPSRSQPLRPSTSQQPAASIKGREANGYAATAASQGGTLRAKETQPQDAAGEGGHLSGGE